MTKLEILLEALIREFQRAIDYCEREGKSPGGQHVGIYTGGDFEIKHHSPYKLMQYKHWIKALKEQLEENKNV